MKKNDIKIGRAINNDIIYNNEFVMSDHALIYMYNGSWMIEYHDMNFDKASLSKAFANKRNNLSHGVKLEKFKILEIVSYSIVRKINYAMILERSGFNKEQIHEIINQIF